MIRRIFYISLVIVFAVACSNKTSDTNTSKTNEDSLTVTDNEPINDNADVQTADTATFEWGSGMCHYIGKYLPAKHSRKQIQTTLDLWQKAIYGMNTDWSANTPDNVSRLKIAELDEEYNATIAFYNAAKPFVAPYFQGKVEVLKKNREKEYKIKRMVMLAYNDPSSLLSSEFEQGDCGGFAKALNSSNEQDLYNAWEKWVHESKVNNGNPDEYVRRYVEKLHSDNPKMYARVDLITYGWWNCMNRSITYMEDADFSEEFKKYFIAITEECEEP